jgi:hypothetical protein
MYIIELILILQLCCFILYLANKEKKEREINMLIKYNNIGKFIHNTTRKLEIIIEE